MSVPFFASSPADRDVLLRQEGVAETLAAAAGATLFLVGIGEVDGRAFLPMASGLIAHEFKGLGRQGAVGEVLGCYLDQDGRKLDVRLHEQVVGPRPRGDARPRRDRGGRRQPQGAAPSAPCCAAAC